MLEIILPELGEGIEKATIAYWHCVEGDCVSKDDDVAEVVTDKATFNIPAGADGIIIKICAQIGEEADVGSAIAIIDA